LTASLILWIVKEVLWHREMCLKVFVSYASEDHNVAELIAGSIGARGHRVFFDRENLPSGDTYEDQIEAAIADAAAFVFLISPEAVTPGRYTLTELGYARTRWRSAKGRVLPVMLRPTPIESVPAYLRTVSILEPEGNVPAEIATAVDKMAWMTSRMLRRAASFAALLSVAALAAWYFAPASPEFDTEAYPPMAHEAGFFGSNDVYNIIFEARNTGAVADEVTEATLEVEPKGALLQRGPAPRELETIAPGARYRGHILVSSEIPEARFRVCVHAKSVRKSCSAWIKWEPSGEFLYRDVVPLDPSIAANATAVASDGAGFIVGAHSPNRIVLLDEAGGVVARLETTGVPQSFSSGPLGLFVGVAGPDEVLALNPKTLEVLDRASITLSPARNLWDQPISTQPSSLAQDGERVWVLTRGGTSTAGLAYFDLDLSKLTAPPYYEEIAFDLRDMRLQSGSDAVWSGRDGTTPASIFRFEPERVTIYGGHDYEIASCASDVLPIDQAILLVPDCKGLVHRVVANDALEMRGMIGSLLGFNSTGMTWERVRLARAGPERVLGALTVRTSGPRQRPEEHKIAVSKLNWPSGLKLAFALDGARIVDFAAGERAMLLLLESDDGVRQLVSPEYD
jgi:hypothetical protein